MSKKKKQQLFNKTYFRRLKLSKRPRDIYMFWSGKGCKIPIMTADHARYEHLFTGEYWQEAEFQSDKEKELQESGTRPWEVPVYIKLTLLLWPALVLAHGDHGLIYVLPFCKKPSKGFWECIKDQAKHWPENEKWNLGAEGRGKGLTGESILKSKGTLNGHRQKDEQAVTWRNHIRAEEIGGN